MRGSLFGYGLANGTVGVYDRSTRLWRVKVTCKTYMIFNIAKFLKNEANKVTKIS